MMDHTEVSNQERIWYSLWLYGIVIDDDSNLASLGNYWNPDGDLTVKPSYYVPDDELSTITLDGPNRPDSPSLDAMAELFRVAS
jgi:hypothetical protein